MKRIKVYRSQDFPGYLPKLNLLFEELFSDGKGFRARFVRQVASRLTLTESTIQLLEQTVEFIHNASLLHDDLVDRSALRRGKPAAWLKYSPESAVLAGDYLLARVMVNLSGFGSINLIQFTAQMISDLLEGEWIQDSLIRDWEIGLEQLDRVHILKTASLFKWCLRAPFIAADRRDGELHHWLNEMGSLLGILFQRGDDLLDFNVRNGENKAILGDLKSGYLNSFAAFAMKSLNKEGQKKFIGSQTMADVELAAGGAENFQSLVRAFDDLNQQLIELYKHYCGQVGGYLRGNEQILLTELLPLTDLLYWRKQ